MTLTALQNNFWIYLWNNYMTGKAEKRPPKRQEKQMAEVQGGRSEDKESKEVVTGERI